MKESFKILRQVLGVYFYFLGPVIVPETTEIVSVMTDAAVTITATVTESIQLESTTTTLSPSEVKSIKATS